MSYTCLNWIDGIDPAVDAVKSAMTAMIRCRPSHDAGAGFSAGRRLRATGSGGETAGGTEPTRRDRCRDPGDRQPASRDGQGGPDREETDRTDRTGTGLAGQGKDGQDREETDRTGRTGKRRTGWTGHGKNGQDREEKRRTGQVRDEQDGRTGRVGDEVSETLAVCLSASCDVSESDRSADCCHQFLLIAEVCPGYTPRICCRHAVW